jgi:sugar-phosphatase
MTARLVAAHLPVPEVMICAEDVRLGKPSPEGYVKAAAGLAVDPSRCVVVEDSPAGVEAGRAAGAQVLAITTTHSADQLARANVVVADLSLVRTTCTDDLIELSARS